MTEPAGAQPADLPVELPKKFEFVIKLKAAQANRSPGESGISDEVIQEKRRGDARIELNAPTTQSR